MRTPVLNGSVVLGIVFALSALLIAAATMSARATPVCPEGMLSYWKFDDGMGTQAQDAVGVNPGTLMGNPEWTTNSISGMALDFDGNDHVIASGPNIAGQFAIEAWIRVDITTATYLAIVDKYDTDQVTSNRGFTFYVSGGVLRLSVYAGTEPWPHGNVQGTQELRDGLWHHVVGTWDGYWMRLYLDGTLHRERSCDYAYVPSDNPLTIGKRYNNWGSSMYFQGVIDEVAVYNRALSPGEIEQHYSNGLLNEDYCHSPNEPPVAMAGPDQVIHAGQTVHLDGSSSYDDNTPSEELGYAWALTEKPSGSSAALTGSNTATPSFVADLPGTYVLSLVVTDAGNLDSEPDEVAVSSFNMAPTADAGPDVAAVVGDVIQLDGTLSTDPDLDPLTFEWAISGAPEGSNASLSSPLTATPTFVPDLPGQYSVRLVVNDGLLDSEPATVVIAVITAEELAENNTMDVLNTVTVLPPASVASTGNQIALGNFLTQAIAALQDTDAAEALNKLDKALKRTDGCVLRGAPDGPGPGRDWVTDCAAQETIYWMLLDALDALSP